MNLCKVEYLDWDKEKVWDSKEMSICKQWKEKKSCRMNVFGHRYGGQLIMNKFGMVKWEQYKKDNLV